MMMSDILSTFEYCGIHYELLDIGDGWQIAVTQHGRHIFGPFSEKYPEGIFWIPEAIRDRDAYRELIEQKIWNIGGDRVWIAPEIQFNIRDRNRYRESLDTPKTIDPGNYSMIGKEGKILLEQSLDLESYNTVTGRMHLDFRRTIRRAPNPLRRLPEYAELMKELSYCGMEQILDLSGYSEENIYAEAWDLLQIRTKGILFIPMYQPVRGTDHYAPAGSHEVLTRQGICLKLTGDSQYKIAYKSAVLTGRFGYMKESETEDTYLIVVNYPNNPSTMYSEEPPQPELAGDTGYSIHVYNDDGASGGFAEMECNMQTIGRPAGVSRSVDRLTTWIFTGSKGRLKTISSVLLGYDFPEI